MAQIQQQQQDPGHSALGRRAEIVHTLLNVASRRVGERITLETVLASFPDLDQPEHRAYFEKLTEGTKRQLADGFQQAWHHLFSSSADLADFDVKASEMDRILLEATQRKVGKEVPMDAWKPARDPVLVIQAQVIPKLQEHLQNVRTSAAELEQASQEAQSKILSLQNEADTLEGELGVMFNSIAQGNASLESVDENELRAVTEELTRRIEGDKY